MKATPYIIFVSFLFSIAVHIHAEKKDTLNMRIMSYNVENLFDCIDDPEKDDEEFLPNAQRQWTRARYFTKLDHIARAIAAVGNGKMPAIVAFCEIESDSCMYDLTHRSLLRNAGYRYIKTYSPDKRGVNVALIYQRQFFKPVIQESIHVTPPSADFRPTRDILHVGGELLNGDTLDVYVYHAPSRNGGEAATEPYRIVAAKTLKANVDQVIHTRKHPQVIIMGDFNDYPKNKSIHDVLGAVAPSVVHRVKFDQLYHLLAARSAKDKDFGSYKYRGDWGLLDHIIVSGSLLKEKSTFKTSESRASVFKADFLLSSNEQSGDKQPFRTYLGTRYINGYSDHLPVYADFTLYY